MNPNYFQTSQLGKSLSQRSGGEDFDRVAKKLDASLQVGTVSQTNFENVSWKSISKVYSITVTLYCIQKGTLSLLQLKTSTVFTIIYYLMENLSEAKHQDQAQKQFQSLFKEQGKPEVAIKRPRREKRQRDCDDEFEPEYHTMKKLKMPINRARLRQGNWSLQENKVYLKFLAANPQFFQSQASRREHRVFCRLSELLNKRRTPDQCRSHHQKLLDPVNGCLSALIEKMQKKIASMEEKVIQQPANKAILKIGLGSGSIEDKSPKQDLTSKIGIWEQGVPASKLNGREVSQTIQQDFFRMTLFKNCSAILIEIRAACIQSY